MDRYDWAEEGRRGRWKGGRGRRGEGRRERGGEGEGRGRDGGEVEEKGRGGCSRYSVFGIWFSVKVFAFHSTNTDR
jgi:hypothetical protein